MKSSIIVIGAGGHAKVVIELLQANGYSIDFCIGAAESPEFCLNIPVLKGDEHLNILWQQGYKHAFVAIGDNGCRQKLAEQAYQAGYQLVNAISLNAIVSPSAKLGVGIAIMPGVVINAECTIGDLVIINTGATIDHDGFIGKGAHIGPQCGLAGNVTVGEKTFLGVGCTVIPGIQIGSEAIVGAGSVIISNILPQVVAVGVPARTIRSKKEVN